VSVSDSASPAHASRVRRQGGRLALHRRRPQLLREGLEDGSGLFSSLFIGQALKVHGHRAPAGQGDEQPAHGRLQDRPMRAEFRGFSHRFINDGVEPDDALGERAPYRLRLRQFWAGERQHPCESRGDLDREGSE
jgi:hypothetical protein